MHPSKALRPDGMHAMFHQKLWDVVREEVADSILTVLNHEDDPTPINQTLICLIPKVRRPMHTQESRPISV